ncbi:MAG: sugar phosphate isomerase/epimerase [Chloroflexi bacterium]|nr:MAG: sugar phosphate isomerase/epimerase [Chloroflexota bacterium]
MSYKLGYCTLRWKNPDLEPGLEGLAAVGWDGWEGRLSLNWMGTPARIKGICANTGMPLAVLTASGTPDSRDPENWESNKRRMEFAAEVGCDCFMYMNGGKPDGRAVTDDDVKAAAEGAAMWAEYAAQLGLEISYHIHTNLLVDSIEHWKLYMANTGKGKLCIDVSHAQLWGYNPVASFKDFASQLNYVHLQDWSSTSRREDGFYDPIWCQVGEGKEIDFVAIKGALDAIGYKRWVTACPGQPIPGRDTPLGEVEHSKGMLKFLKGIGY